MTAWEYMINLNQYCQFMSRERTGKATNSEVKRWLLNKAVIINGERLQPNDEVIFPVNELILFPKRNKITIL